MNEYKESFGLDNIQPLEPVSTNPVPEETNQQEALRSYTEMPSMESKSEYAFDNTEPQPVDPVVPVEPQPIIEESVYMEQPISYTEIPVTGVTEQPPVADIVNEHPDAKISLHKETEQEVTVASNLPEEKMDKATIWLLVWLFLGFMIVIIALPYLYELF